MSQQEVALLTQAQNEIKQLTERVAALEALLNQVPFVVKSGLQVVDAAGQVRAEIKCEQKSVMLSLNTDAGQNAVYLAVDGQAAGVLVLRDKQGELAGYFNVETNGPRFLIGNVVLFNDDDGGGINILDSEGNLNVCIASREDGGYVQTYEATEAGNVPTQALQEPCFTVSELELRLYLGDVLRRWHDFVLHPLQLATLNPDQLPREHPYERRRARVLQFALKQLAEPSDYDVTLDEHNFICLQDFLNAYERDTLTPLGLLTGETPSPPHPYYDMRQDFLLKELKQINTLVQFRS